MMIDGEAGTCMFRGKIGFVLALSIIGAVQTGARESVKEAALPEFEVASIRPSPPVYQGADFRTYPGGRIVASYCPVRFLIRIAFHLPDFQISGGPNWIAEDRFQIEAKPPASSRSSASNPFSPELPPNDEQRQMLQALLIERFHLQFHREIASKKVLALTLSGKALRLQAAKRPDADPWAGGIGGGYPDACGLRGTNISMPLFAERLTRWLRTPVLDKTGLQGSFDFTFETGEGDLNSESEIISSILDSLKGLGLALKKTQGRVETLVIDHVERPSEN